MREAPLPRVADARAWCLRPQGPCDILTLTKVAVCICSLFSFYLELHPRFSILNSGIFNKLELPYVFNQ